MQKNNYKNNKNYNNNNNNHRNQNFDSNGPTGRVKGNAKSISEKYQSMARDAYASGDYILMETLYQHAEHYFRINNYLNDQAENKRKAKEDRNKKAKESQAENASIEENASDKEIPVKAEPSIEVLDLNAEEKTEETKKKPLKRRRTSKKQVAKSEEKIEEKIEEDNS